ncbi:hypothetical protein PMAYCL1PPCAC_01466, partial [Pristionchus mayeri]
SQVSTHFYKGVHEFLRTAGNRPGLKAVELQKTENGLRMRILLYPNNLPFYDLTRLDWSRFERSMECKIPILQVMLSGAEDPAVEQVFDLLSAPIRRIDIEGNDCLLSSDDLSLCAKLLEQASRISYAYIWDV